MKKLLLPLLIFTLLSIVSRGQDFPYGNTTPEEIAMKKYDKDTSAHAVVLNEYGTSSIDVMNDDDIKLIYGYHVKIKIFDAKGFEHGDVAIPYYSNDGNTFEEVRYVKGITTYTDDNGNIKTAEIDDSKIFNVKENKYWSRKKFAMPALRSGCIIEYTYQVLSPYFDKFHGWDFQSDIPKVYSEYEIHIPAFWNYNASIIGALKITKNVAEAEQACFNWHGAKCDCSHYIYGMGDIPAFIEEGYMTAPTNFLSAITFELSDYTSLTNGSHTKIAQEWKDVDYELKHDDGFGNQIKKKDLFKDRLAPLLNTATDSLAKAKIVYEYIKKNIKWNEFYANGSNDGIRKALENHTGTVADINLALTAALDEAGFKAEAVLLSTREHGFVNKLYPVRTEFNYVIAKVNINNKSYLLDATDPLLSFGMLPMRCMNDQGRVMSLDKPSYWIDLDAPQKENNTYTLDFTLQPDGKITGSMIHYSIGYAAYEKRKEIKGFNSIDEYIESLDEKSNRLKILKSDITGVDSLDGPVTETYQVEIKEFDNLDHDRLRFDPYILDQRNINPFKLAERSYPVDWGVPSNDRFTLTMHLPDKYIIETPPQNVSVSLPNNGGKFVTYFETDNNSFTFSHVIQFNKPIYSSAEYPYLKELYNKIILSEKAEMTFKKTL